MKRLFLSLILCTALAAGLGIVSASPAAAGVREYTVGEDTIAVSYRHLPKHYRPELREAVALIERYTTSNIRVAWSCWPAKMCIDVRATDDRRKTGYGAAATHWQWTRVHRTDGTLWNGWMGNAIYVLDPYTKRLSSERLRGMFAHELGHAFTLRHDYRLNDYMCNKPHSIMGNCGDGRRYFSVANRTFDWSRNETTGAWERSESDTSILSRF